MEYSEDNSIWTQIQDTASTSYTHTTLTYGEVLHYYRVRGYNLHFGGANTCAGNWTAGQTPPP